MTRADRRRLVAGALLAAGLLSGCSGSSQGVDAGAVGSGASTPGSAVALTASGSGSGSGVGSPGAVSASGSPAATSAGGAGTAGASRSASVSPTIAGPRPSATQTLVPPPSPSITTVPGYVYTTAPASVVRALAALTASQPGVFSAPTARTARKGGTTVGTVAVLALNRVFVGRSEVEGKLVDGLVQGLSGKGYTVSDHALSGVRVVAAESTSSSAVVWYRSGTVVLVISNAKVGVPLAYAQAYLKQA